MNIHRCNLSCTCKHTHTHTHTHNPPAPIGLSCSFLVQRRHAFPTLPPPPLTHDQRPKPPYFPPPGENPFPPVLLRPQLCAPHPRPISQARESSERIAKRDTADSEDPCSICLSSSAKEVVLKCGQCEAHANNNTISETNGGSLVVPCRLALPHSPSPPWGVGVGGDSNRGCAAFLHFMTSGSRAVNLTLPALVSGPCEM